VHGNRLPIEYSLIVGNIKNIISSKSSKKWNEEDIYKYIKWGIFGRMNSRLALLLAHIFALWSSMYPA
jgi:hypothetical protein